MGPKTPLIDPSPLSEWQTCLVSIPLLAQHMFRCYEFGYFADPVVGFVAQVGLRFYSVLCLNFVKHL